MAVGFLELRSGSSRRASISTGILQMATVAAVDGDLSTHKSAEPDEARLMSACPPTAAQKRTFHHFGLGPLAAVSRCSELSYETGQWSIRGLRPKSKTAWGHPTYRP